jgi:hypothetical protein
MPTRNGTNPSATLKEIGASGLNISAGIVTGDMIPDLKADRAIKVYAQMRDNDPTIGAIMFAIDMMLRGVEWYVEPHQEGQEEDAEFVQQCMDDMSHSWSDFISEIMTMLTFGFSFFEIVYKHRQGEQSETGSVPSSKHTDGKVGWRKFGSRSQDSLSKWDYDDKSQSLKGFVQRAAPEYKDVAIPITKGLLFRTSVVKNNPEGRSVLRNAYRPWYFKKHFEEIEGMGIERDLAGLPMMRVDSEILMEASNGNAGYLSLVNSLKDIIKNVRQDKEAGVLLPIMKDQDGNDQIIFELMSSGGSRTFDITNIIARYDQRIAMTVLADFILLGHEAVGSFALSSDKTSLFSVALGAWLDAIEDVLNRFAVHRLFRINGMDTEFLPEIKHKDIEKPDLAVLGGFLAALAGMGMQLFPDETLEKHFRELVDLPEQSEEAKEGQDSEQMNELMGMVSQFAQDSQGEEPAEEEAPADGME